MVNRVWSGHKNAKLLVIRLIPKDETYHGEQAEEGPDLHVELDGYRMISCPLFANNGQVITQQIRGDSGCYRSEGVFVASGAGVRQGETVGGANLIRPSSICWGCRCEARWTAGS